MAKSTNKFTNAAQIILGRGLERVRLSKNITRKQLGRIVNVPEQQIVRYESGDFIPLPMLERLMETMGEPIQKKFIRKISALRHLEIKTGNEQTELSDLYLEIFAECHERLHDS